MKKWIFSTAYPALKAGPVRFQVLFNREGKGHTIGCHVRLTLGNQILSGYSYAGELTRALTGSLTHLSRGISTMSLAAVPQPLLS